jgi:hypothetical protein
MRLYRVPAFGFIGRALAVLSAGSEFSALRRRMPAAMAVILLA